MERLELLTEFILQSDLIEGINDGRNNLEEEIRSGKQDGHIGAILYLESLAKDKSHFLTAEDIKKVQGLITEEQGIKRADLKILQKYIGEYRDVRLGMEDDIRALPEDIQFGINDLFHFQIGPLQKWRLDLPEQNKIMRIADIYFDFETIHPFIDGNGRTGRAIVFYLMSYLNMQPFIFTDEEKWLMHFPALKNQERIVMRKYFYQKSGLL